MVSGIALIAIIGNCQNCRENSKRCHKEQKGARVAPFHFPFLRVLRGKDFANCQRLHAARDFPLYTGRNSSVTKVSQEVGVVFRGERFSSAFMYPEFKDADISRSESARLREKPSCNSTGRSCSSGSFTYSRSRLLMAPAMIAVTSL